MKRKRPSKGPYVAVPKAILDAPAWPLPTARGAMDQGSSTARAPAQAGGAGSSPAPDADLTEMLCQGAPRACETVRC